MSTTEETAPSDPMFAKRYMEIQAVLDEALVRHNGEGVCAVGAYVWYRKVKAGADPAEAFASLPDIADEGSDGLTDTADFAKKEAGMVYTLAWELAYRNDEIYDRMTPEERYTAFLAWIDAELGIETEAVAS